jgi:hypothetical protein
MHLWHTQGENVDCIIGDIGVAGASSEIQKSFDLIVVQWMPPASGGVCLVHRTTYYHSRSQNT